MAETLEAGQTPDQNRINLTASCRFDQFFALRSLAGSGTHIFNGFDHFPVAPSGVLAHRLHLQRQRLLIVGRDPCIKADAKRFYPGQKPSSSRSPQRLLNTGGTLLKNSMAKNIS